jgi:uncharacterized protein (TIGR02246 family)
MNTLKRSIDPAARLATLVFVCLLTIGADAPVSAATADGARAAIAAQSRALMDGMQRGDAGAAAEIFTVDAKLIVSGVDDVIDGRTAIENFWQSALRNGVKGLRLTTIDVEGAGPLLIETGTYQALGAGGGDLERGHYLFVWKNENGTWRIHRDIGSARQLQTAAAAVDRVGFPRDYRAALKLLSVAVKDDEPSVMTAYGNALATSITVSTQLPYPYGTVIAMEFAHGVRDGEKQLMHDTSGTALKADVARIDVMRRERGYGEGYGENRAGEWEFASYRPDGSTLVSPENAGTCAACHRKAGAERDFVYRLRVPRQ